jgi:hypothetical protein
MQYPLGTHVGWARAGRVADHAGQNKMPARNLGAVFGPTLLTAPDELGVAHLGQQTVLVEVLIQSVDVLFARVP